MTINQTPEPLINVAHIHQLKSVSVMKPSYNWFFSKHNVTYHSTYFDYSIIEKDYDQEREKLTSRGDVEDGVLHFY